MVITPTIKLKTIQLTNNNYYRLLDTLEDGELCLIRSIDGSCLGGKIGNGIGKILFLDWGFTNPDYPALTKDSFIKDNIERVISSAIELKERRLKDLANKIQKNNQIIDSLEFQKNFYYLGRLGNIDELIVFYKKENEILQKEKTKKEKFFNDEIQKLRLIQKKGNKIGNEGYL